MYRFLTHVSSAEQANFKNYKMEPFPEFKLLARRRPVMASLFRILRITKPINQKEPNYCDAFSLYFNTI
jgi:hypothetical protein